jgi:hypothetical protein
MESVKEQSMLWDTSALENYGVAASDGRLGSVSDFLFEDTSWMIRWLVVDTGNWLSGRKVLLPLSALRQPDPSLRQFPITLTKQQVKDSPDIDTDRPVSRQHENHVYDYYGWGPYWDGGFVPPSGAIATPFVAPQAFSGQKPRDVGGPDADSNNGDPHLRSVREVTGYRVHAVDGEIGHVQDFIVEDAHWSIRYIEIDTNSWWFGKKVLIAPQSVLQIVWEERRINLEIDRGKVEGSPRYDPSITVDGAYEERLRNYYGYAGL